MEIFLDYARRLDLRDRDGEPLVKWSTPEECFEAWKECTRGRPCDYTGLSYEKLRGGSGIQWPCNDEAPDGTERLYEDLTFATLRRALRGLRARHRDRRDALRSRVQGARARRGRAILKAAEWTPPHEWAARRVPLRAHHRPHRLPLPHAHEDRPSAGAASRRARRLGRALRRPTPTGSASRRARLLRVSSPRGLDRGAGAHRRPARPGVVFVPFHYGYWDTGDDAGPDGRPRAANELTMTIWDPVSKQPQLKTAAVKVETVAMKIGPLLAHLRELETTLAAELRAAAERHRDDHDVYHQCHTLRPSAADARARALEPLARLYGGVTDWHRGRQPAATICSKTSALCTSASARAAITWTMAVQAAKALRDAELLACATESATDATSEADWFLTRIKTGAPQALTVE